MDSSFGFCDLNIPVAQPNLKETVIEALKIGYKTIALTREVVDEPVIDNSKKKRKKDKEQLTEIPPPYEFTLNEEELKKYGITKTPRIFSRITIIHSQPNSSIIYRNKDVLAQYDLLAFIPTTEGSFKQICQSMDVDIIALNIDQLEYRPSRKLIQLAIKRDIYFELSYGPCIKSSINRQGTIQLGHTLHQVSRCVNVIITSKAQRQDELRAPYDVANLGILFGLTQGAAKEALLSTQWAVIHCSKARRKGGGQCSSEIDASILEKNTKYSSLIQLDNLINLHN